MEEALYTRRAQTVLRWMGLRPVDLQVVPGRVGEDPEYVEIAQALEAGRIFDNVLLPGLKLLRGRTLSQRRTAMRWALDMLVPRVACLLQEAKRHRARDGAIARWRCGRIWDEAIGLDPFRPMLGGVEFRLEEKGNSEQRRIYRLKDVRDLARQRKLVALHRALQSPHAGQLASGECPIRLEQVLEEQLPHMKRVLLTDVADCFGSIRHGALQTDLLLPQQVTEAHVTGPLFPPRAPMGGPNGDIRRVHRTGTRYSEATRGSANWMAYQGPYPSDPCAAAAAVKEGVLPGLPTSALAAEIALDSIALAVEAAAPGVRVFIHVDNFLVMLPRAEDDMAVRKALYAAGRRVLSERSVRELMRRIRVQDPKSGFSYLGRHFVHDGSALQIKSEPGYWGRVEDRQMSAAHHHPGRMDRSSLRRGLDARIRQFNVANEAEKAARVYDAVLPILDDPESPFPPPPDDPSDFETILYTDGACKLDVGGWAAIYEAGPAASRDHIGFLRSLPKSHPTMENCVLTSAQEMELRAVVAGLGLLPEGNAVIGRSDSRYVVDHATLDLPRWAQNGYRRTNGHLVAHRRYWRRLHKELMRLRVKFEWVEGHSGDPGNQKADRMARYAARMALEHFFGALV